MGYVITVPERYGRIKRFGCSRSSKVIDFGTNRKWVCNFLLVRRSKLGPILQRFGDIAGFCAPEWPYPYSTLILGVFSLHQITHVGLIPSRSRKLFGRVIIFEVCQPTVCDHGTELYRRQNVSAIQGHPRSLLLVQIEGEYATSY